MVRPHGAVCQWPQVKPPCPQLLPEEDPPDPPLEAVRTRNDVKARSTS